MSARGGRGAASKQRAGAVTDALLREGTLHLTPVRMISLFLKSQDKTSLTVGMFDLQSDT